MQRSEKKGKHGHSIVFLHRMTGQSNKSSYRLNSRNQMQANTGRSTGTEYR